MIRELKAQNDKLKDFLMMAAKNGNKIDLKQL